MGNKVGFQIENNQIKIAYLATQKSDIQFFEQNHSNYLIERFDLKNGNSFFFFRFTTDQFINLKQHSAKIELYQEHFKQYMNVKVDVYMNTETSLSLQNNPPIRNAVKYLLQGEFTEKNRHNSQSSLLSLNTLNYLGDEKQFYKFDSQKGANQLHQITSNIEIKQIYCSLPQQSFLLASLRKGALFFKVSESNHIEKIAGSIIGEQTISQILLSVSNNKDIEFIINTAFEKGQNKNVDLLVEDIYGKTFQGLGMNGSIIASSLAKLSQEKSESSFDDQAKSLIIAFGINIAQFIVLQMQIQSLNTSVLIANKFHNRYFYFIVQSIVKFFKPDAQILFSKHSNFISCIGNIKLQ